jgi:iron complex outermembrane receptor protein
MLKLNRLVTLAVGLAALGFPLAADTLSGKVKDEQGAVVVNASLTLQDRASGNQRMATSSASGDFSFNDISSGKYLLQAQSEGSALSASEDVTVDGSTTKDLTLSVARSTVRVLVTATGTPVFEQEVARTIDVVDAQQINERDEYSIAEVFRTVPGVQIQTQVGGIYQIRTRGLRNQDTAVLIDGLRFRDAAAIGGDASGFLSDMNVTDLGRAEYLRGSGSSLYGTNAIAGAVSLNSNEGGGKTHGSVRAEGGGLGFFRGTANLSGGLGNDRFVYSGGASQLNVTGGVRGSTPNKNSSGQLFGKYYFTPKMSLSGRVWGSNVFQRSVESPAFNSAILANFPAGTSPVKVILLPDDQLSLYETRQAFNAGNATLIPSVPDPDGSRTSVFNASAFIFRHELTKSTSWRASYQRVNTKRAQHNGPAGVNAFGPLVSQIGNTDGNTDQLQLRVDSEFARFNRVTAGYEFEKEYTDSLANRNLIGGALVRTTGKQLSHSIYGQDQMHFFGDRLQVVVGGRIQKFDLKTPVFTGTTSPYETTPVKSPDSAFTGDISVAYFVQSSNTKFRGHVGNGYRAPSLYERFGSGYFGGSFTFYGDPRLSPEKSVSFDTGIDQWFLNNKVRASATYFYTDLTQSIIFPSALPGDPFGRVFGGYANSGKGGISRGVELSTQFSPSSKTSVTMSYTNVNSDQRTPTFSNYFYKALNTSANMFSLTATQWVTSKLNLTVDYYVLGDSFQGTFGANRVMQFAGPNKVDLVANYKFTLTDSRSVDIYTKIENLGNVRYSDNGFLAPGAWAIGGLKFNF